MTTNLTQIRKILRECQFNPKEPGPLKVIADCGNPEYFCIRAIESIQTSKEFSSQSTTYQQALKTAIQLLTLALAESHNANSKAKVKK